MLTQYQITLAPDGPARGRNEWAYRLYAILLGLAPQEFSGKVHSNDITPLSQYVLPKGDHVLWIVTLLGSESENALRPVLEGTDSYYLERDAVNLKVKSRKKEVIEDVEDMLLRGARHGAIHHLKFCTPTAFKSRGNYLNLPTTRLILQNLIRKWNASLPECLIEDEDDEGMEAMADGILCREFQLQSRSYSLKGNTIPGFVGVMTLDNRLKGFHRDLASALLIFAGYAGIGIKTTLGMGGVQTP